MLITIKLIVYYQVDKRVTFFSSRKKQNKWKWEQK